MSILMKKEIEIIIMKIIKIWLETVNKKRKILRKKDIIEIGEFIDGYYVTKKDIEMFQCRYRMK